MTLGDFGSYPASLLPSAYSFDHYTHIRADLFAPRGPLPGPPPPSGAGLLRRCWTGSKRPCRSRTPPASACCPAR